MNQGYVTQGSESHQEAVMPTPLLTPKRITNTATWKDHVSSRESSRGDTANGELQNIAARTMRDAVEAVRSATATFRSDDIIFGSRG